jgi:hypothetical protein
VLLCIKLLKMHCLCIEKEKYKALATKIFKKGAKQSIWVQVLIFHVPRPKNRL